MGIPFCYREGEKPFGVRERQVGGDPKEFYCSGAARLNLFGRRQQMRWLSRRMKVDCVIGVAGNKL